ncbi:AAA family ATPase [Mesobacterium sp. TK19101]|uniref:AAA family ATPase n=1 Tax=Mesobacterium hydrothermale TaxID=3111907 RepID=A0ABU6HG13_9RHOB|nr:AAA family ATPase [Mesobacterium sp. TK19101]MEC3860679.1 AAA family ATPase [Mesobacterium sp. TK19101]
MKRVMIVGQPGSGKSTLAREIGKRTGLPVYHMDQIHWQPGWVARDRGLRVHMANEIELRKTWIFEGGLSETYPHRLSRADTLIVLEIPLWRRAWRVFKRTLTNLGRNRPDLPENCPERFDPEFWKWIWTTRHSAVLRHRALIKIAPADVAVHHLCNSAEVRAFLESLDSADAPGH